MRIVPRTVGRRLTMGFAPMVLMIVAVEMGLIAEGGVKSELANSDK